jgi:hypothetical protein
VRKILNNLSPLLFALISCLFYLLIYRPSPNSTGFTTACLAFCAGLGWSAVIILFNRRQRVLMYTYVVVSLLIPVLAVEVFSLLPVDRLGHHSLWVLLLISLIALIIYISPWAANKKIK